MKKVLRNKKVSVLVLVFILLNNAYSQTGPGGVGSSTNNKLWLKANEGIVFSTSPFVKEWNDMSGNGNNATQVSGVNQPQQTVISGRTVIRFDGAQDFMNVPGLTAALVNNQYSIFAVGARSVGTTKASNYFLGGSNNVANNCLLFGFGNTTTRFFLGQVNNNLWGALIPGSDGTEIGSYGLFSGFLNSTGHYLYQNGVQIASNINTTPLTGYPNPYLGRFLNTYYNIEIAELIVYNTALNSAQRKIVENYLAAKHNITITNDMYGFEAFHKNEVAGIGRDDASNLHNDSRGTGAIRINNPSELDDGEYLFWGHDNGTWGAWSSSECPSSDFRRQVREWRFDATGNVGSVDITFYTNGLPAPPGGFTKYVVLIDEDGNFNSGAIAYEALNVAPNEYKASGIIIPDGYYVTLGVVDPKIYFETSASSGHESVTSPNVFIKTNYYPATDVSVTCKSSDGTAVQPSDYTQINGVYTISAGNNTTVVTLNIVNDGDSENDETFNLTLSAPTTGGVNIGTPSTHTYTILASDRSRQINFVTTLDGGLESNSPVIVNVEVSSIDPVNPTTVNYVVSGTATGSGVDYVLANGTLTIPAGSNIANPPISITITNDNINENTENIIITLSNPVGTDVCLGNDYIYTYIITDDDPQPQVSFTNSFNSASEEWGSANVTLQLSQVSGRDISVNYTVSGTATGSGVDYSNLASGIVVIPAGSTSVDLAVNIINDDIIEVDESIIIELTGASGADIGTIPRCTLIINDNDFFGWKGPGGVGDEITNLLWLRADKGTSTTTHGNPFGLWSDQSGNNNHCTQTNVNNQPIYRANMINSKPAIRFGGTDDFMLIDAADDGLNELINSSYTIYTVGARNTNLVNYFIGGSSNANNECLRLGWSSTAPLRFSLLQNGNTVSGTPVTSSIGTFGVFGGIYNSLEGHYVLENGTIIGSNINTIPLSSYPTPYLGRYLNTYYEVDIAEMVIYNRPLTSTQRTIVESYLGGKYGINVANSRYAYITTYPNDIAGIGRTTINDMHTCAKGSGIIKIGNATDLDDGEYFLHGHDGGSVTAFTMVEAPPNAVRLPRKWRADMTGNIGAITVTLYVDIPDADIPSFDPNKVPVIMVDADGNFSDGAIMYEMINVGDIDGFGETYQAKNVVIPDGYYFTFGEVIPKVQFATTSSNEMESQANVSVGVSLNFIPSTAYYVDFNVTGGTATNGVDYNLTPGTLTIPAGSSTANISITIVDDSNIETPDETIVLSLTNPTAPLQLGTNTTFTYTINDNDLPKKIQFRETSTIADESISNINVIVEILSGTGSPSSVNYTLSGTASNGNDYTVLGTGTVTVASGQTTGTITLNVIDDNIPEGLETIVITLSNPSSDCNLGINRVYTHSIIDNDPLPTIQFQYTNSSGEENIQNPNIKIILSQASGSEVRVSYTVSGTATQGGVDYVLNEGVLILPPGTTEANIIPSIVDDAIAESPEYITITLSNPVNATLGTNIVYTYTILDNDYWGYTGPGGVGDPNVNNLWLRADAGVIKNSSNLVSQWLDQSGNGNHYSSDNLINNPLYIENYLHSKPIIRFDGINDYLRETSGTSDLEGKSFGIFAVAARRSTTKMNYILGGSDPNNILQLLWRNNLAPNNFRFTIGNSGTFSNITVTVSDNLNQWSIFNANKNISTGSSLYENSVLLGSNINTTPVYSYPNPYIGANNGNPPTSFADVDVAEIIQYNAEFNNTQRIIVENYLAAKYNISIANDKYSYELTHSNEVAGIGRLSSSDLHLTAKGSGIVRIGDANDLENGEFLLFGHDGQSISSWVTTECPPDIERLPREWRFDHSGGDGSVGTISISLDNSVLPSPSPGYTKRVLLVDADGDFSSGAEIYEMIPADGSYYKAINVNVPDGYYITFGNIIPKVQFVQSSSSGYENQTNPSIQITLNYITSSNVDVSYVSSEGPAPNATGGGVDYSLPTGTTTILYGTKIGYINPVIFNDVTAESSENFTITLVNATNGVTIGTNNTHVYTINDDDQARQIQFYTTSASGDESFTNIEVRVTINIVDNTNPTSVNYTISGTAVNNSDYILNSGTATIPAGSLYTIIPITIIDDHCDESPETIVITLSNPNNAILGQNQVYTYTIIDNDNEPTVQFAYNSSVTSESNGYAYIQVSLSEESCRDVTVQYSIDLSSTAIGGSIDYFLTDGILTIPAGSTSANIAVQIIDDALIETNETVVIKLSSPVGATLGSTNQHILTITDNDDIGFVGPGGVGKTETMSMWLDAMQLSITPVAIWVDISGNNNNATQSTGAQQPSLVIGTGPNGKNKVIFSNAGGAGNQDFMNINYNPGTSIGGGNYSVITVGRRKDNNSPAYFIGGSNGVRQDIFIGWSGTGGGNDNVNFSDNGSGITYAGPNTDNFDILIGTFNLLNGKVLYFNGNQVGTNSNNLPLNSNLTSPYISRYTNNYYNSEISEIIQYRVTLNTTQRIIVENYLSSKYAISIVNDKFAYDVTYGNEVIGIGRESTNDFHSAAKGRGIVKISSPNSLDVGDYLLLGHNNGNLSPFTSVGAPSYTQIINRVWRFDETGNIGTITVDVDASSLEPLNSTYTKYGIIIDEDGNFTTTTDQQIYELRNIGGNNYQATNVSIGGDKFMTICRFTPIVQFETASSSGNENVSPASIVVKTNFVPTNNIIVNYHTTNITALNDWIDYFLPSDGQVIINAGQTTTTIQPSIVYDVIPEGDEQFKIILDGATGCNIGSISEHVFTIKNVPNTIKIEFAYPTMFGDESFTSVNIPVKLNSQYNQDITANYTIIGGTATNGAGNDYVLANGIVTINAGNTTGFITLTVNDDLLDEIDETIIIQLSNPLPVGVTLGTNTTLTYTIIDNDPTPTVQFTYVSSFGSEATVNPIIEISLSSVSGQNVSVSYSVTGGTAVVGSDYLPFSGTATILAGNLTTTISPTIINDASVEPSETIIITLSSPTGATIGANSTHTYSIIDDDDDGYTGPGGVGNSLTNKLWLRADLGVVENNGLISQWTDQSGNNCNATQTNIANQPTYVLGVINGLPVIRFNGFSSYIQFNTPPAIGNSPYTLITVNSRSTSNLFNHVFGTTVNVENNDRFIRFGYTNDNRFIFRNRNAGGHTVWGVLINPGLEVFSIFTGTATTSGKKLYENNTLMTNGNVTTANTLINPSLQDYFNIGFHNPSGAGKYGDIDVAEAIIYNKELNSAQRKIVNNYLAAKYGISISDDYYSFDITHGREVAGIGRDNSTNFHTRAKGTGMVDISSPNSLDNGDYLLWGHDGGNNTTWTTTNAPTDCYRIARTWRLDMTGNVGTVVVRGHGFIGGISFPADKKPVLILDEDGDFTSGAILYEMVSEGGGIYKADNVLPIDNYYLTFGYITPKVSFVLNSSSGNENVSPASITVQLNYIPATNVTVNYTVTDITATGGGVDYLLNSPGTVVIPAGSRTANIQPIIQNDVEAESAEKFSITLTGATAPVVVGIPGIHEFTIIDDDNLRYVHFQNTWSLAQENISPCITIVLSSADPVNPTTVYYTLSGTATGGGVDYNCNSGIAIIPPGSTSTSICLNIVNDNLYESNETIILTLSNPTNSTLGPNSVYTHTIIDDDNIPIIQFASSTSNVSEASITANISVTLSSPSGAETQVYYSVVGGTASGAGIDYTLSNGWLIIPTGNTSGNIVVSINNDGIIEPNEDIIISLSTPVNAILGTITTHTLTILDDDNIGFTGPGGVGNENFLSLWLRADYGVPSTPVSVWNDQSGNSNNATQTTVSRQPDLVPNVIGSYPVVRFIASGGANSDMMEYTLAGSSTIENSSYTMFIYGCKRAVNASYLLGTNVANRFRIGWSSGSNTYYLQEGIAITGTTSLGANQFGILGCKLDMSNGKYLYENSYLRGSNTNTTPLSPNAAAKYQIACDNGNYYGVDIAELIKYKYPLNTAQRIIVENYLATKYGSINSLPGASRKYMYGSTHPHMVIGIGQHSSTEFHYTAKGRGIIKISNATSMNDGDYLLLGHDSANITTWTTVGAPTASGTYRLAREWRFDETGDVGTITVELYTGSLPSLPTGYNYLLVLDNDNDGDYTDGAYFYPMTNMGGNIWKVDNVNITNDNRFIIACGRNITKQSGNFNNPSTWLMNVVPGANEEAIINTGHYVTLTDNQSVGAITILNGGTLDCQSYTLTLNTGTITNTEGTFIPGTGTVVYQASGNQNITGTSTNITYNNLTLSGSGTKLLVSNIDVNGNLTINAGPTLDVNSTGNYQINLAGNWQNSGTFLPRNGVVVFDGNTDQTILSSVIFTNLTINKPSGNVILGNHITVNGTLTLTKGNIVLGVRNLYLGTNATTSGASQSSYVQADGNGKVIRSIGGTGITYHFPVGCSSYYSPVTFKLNSGTLIGATLGINVRNAAHPNLVMTTTSHLTRYWIVEPTGISSPNYDITLNYNVTDDVVGSEGTIFCAKYSSGTWTHGPTYAAGGSVSWAGCTSFSDFTGGDHGALPVSLLVFNATANEDVVDLTWTTASEVNNDYFTVERSKDGLNYEIVMIVDGAGNSNKLITYKETDYKPYKGTSFYRLKQTDFDGKYTYSKPVMVYIDPSIGFDFDVIYNPEITKDVIVTLKGVENGDLIIVTMYDIVGKSLYTQTYAVKNDKVDKFNISSNFAPGNYIVAINRNGEVLSKKVVIY